MRTSTSVCRPPSLSRLICSLLLSSSWARQKRSTGNPPFSTSWQSLCANISPSCSTFPETWQRCRWQPRVMTMWLQHIWNMYFIIAFIFFNDQRTNMNSTACSRRVVSTVDSGFRPNLALQQKCSFSLLFSPRPPVVQLRRSAAAVATDVAVLRLKSWTQLEFSVTAVCAVLWLPVQSLGDLTPDRTPQNCTKKRYCGALMN